MTFDEAIYERLNKSVVVFADSRDFFIGILTAIHADHLELKQNGNFFRIRLDKISAIQHQGGA
jgi:transcriptional antiterminator Rof (Rho-off)